MPESIMPVRPIRLLLSDVDGTLVTRDKVLSQANIDAVRRLGEHGIGFTVTSARPPQGLAMLIKPLRIELPVSGFNGGLFTQPDFKVIEERRIGLAEAKAALAAFDDAGVSVWLFTAEHWVVRDPEGPRVDHETFTIGYPPRIVEEFDDALLGAAIKMVGVSDDHPALAELEARMQAAFGARIAASRSQVYYLDITHPNATKGTVVDRLATLLRIDATEIATIGDSANDVAMFERSGFAIAMGNANETVRAKAQAVTGSNEESGFAQAVERYLLA
ncbi:hypothetical protein SAMN07250955_10891 [Arboricoccus pini]|uniref:Cof subfamily of IIB subfamily of haloacid dehalogenase superfamily/HAD-superfamily hydrolase, subfamily IIB n=1 Tax=Arboricoccus pini TaxID=1963835 RepID=A0A212RGG5_9PROT|nr:Cof-type HAD-IIB family hydrolase [Arboricoccus pini]SNB71270.1 hypothetical protein SAMN07250955_10891 [Arboricoccus pini]